MSSAPHNQQSTAEDFEQRSTIAIKQTRKPSTNHTIDLRGSALCLRPQGRGRISFMNLKNTRRLQDISPEDGDKENPRSQNLDLVVDNLHRLLMALNFSHFHFNHI